VGGHDKDILHFQVNFKKPVRRDFFLYISRNYLLNNPRSSQTISSIKTVLLASRIDTLCTKSFLHGKNGFVTATKLGTTNNFLVAANKNFAAATKRFVD